VTHHRIGTFSSGGLTLFRQSWTPGTGPHPAVVIVHGIHEHSGRYEWVAERLASAGFAVHAYDLRGHGRSHGPRALVRSLGEHLDDLDALLSVIRREGQQGPDPLFLLGHSLGGCIVATYLTHRRRHPIAGAILSAPALRRFTRLQRAGIAGLGLLARVAPTLGLVRITQSGISRDAGVVDAYRADPLVHRGFVPAATAAAIVGAVLAAQRHAGRARVPLLVLHGTADPITPPLGGAWFCEHAGSADRTFRLFPGLRHELLNEPEREDVTDTILAWLKARSGSVT
jgi:alpha-beta hydrolase superfamily lysophospholipase